MNKRVLGDFYELKAVNFLEKLGFSILERNFRCKIGEIDIICRDGKYLVFLEVKYRNNYVFGEPVYAVDKKKQHKIYKVAQYYLLSNNISFDTAIRFDVVVISGDNIEIIRNAFGGI